MLPYFYLLVLRLGKSRLEQGYARDFNPIPLKLQTELHYDFAPFTVTLLELSCKCRKTMETENSRSS